MAKEVGKEFEFVPCGIHMVETGKYGKAYGEALIVSEALQISKLLSENEEIYKITGRIFLENNRVIVRSSMQSRNVFMLIDKEKWCYTFIFKFNKFDYLNYFEPFIVELLKTYNSMLESSLYKIIIDHSDSLEVDCFHYWPMLDGIQGGSGSTYKSSFKGKMYHNLLCLLGAYRHKSIFQKFILY